MYYLSDGVSRESCLVLTQRTCTTLE